MSKAMQVETVQVELMPPAHMPRLPMLDGWRALSILAVMQCHLGAYGGRVRGDIQVMLGINGMALFFCLSGYLITSTLYVNPSVRVFLIRRMARILPAAWVFLAVTLPFMIPKPTAEVWWRNFLFLANVGPCYFAAHHNHMWSLCVEVQFYALIAVLFAVLRKRAFLLLPVLGLLITVHRILTHNPESIFTDLRADEIMAGATLAMLLHERSKGRVMRVLARTPPIVPFALLIAGGITEPQTLALQYARPYFAALLVGCTICQPEGRWSKLLSAPVLAYIAAISYALYLWHPMVNLALEHPEWTLTGYLARGPLGMLLLIGVAHLSTYCLEKPCIRWGNQLAKRVQRSRSQASGTPAAA